MNTSPALRYVVGNRVVDSPPVLLDSYEVKTELHFVAGVTTSNVDLTALHDAENDLWISLWFKLDEAFSSASSANQIIFGKYVDATNLLTIQLLAASGKLQFNHLEGGSEESLLSTKDSWAGGTWHHVICSLSTTSGKRMIVNGGTAVAEAGDTTAISLIANMVLGALDNGTTNTGFAGAMRDVSIGNDELTGAEEAALLQGIVPVDATEVYKLNEGTGTTAISSGSGANNGTIDSANTWVGTTVAIFASLVVPVGYDILFLYWNGAMHSDPNTEYNILMTFNGDGGGNYDWSKRAFNSGTVSTNSATYISIGNMDGRTSNMVHTSGFLTIFNRAGQQKSVIGGEANFRKGQTNLNRLTELHIASKWRTTAGVISLITLTASGAGNYIGGTKFWLLGINSKEGG